MRKFPNLEIKANLESYKLSELRFIAKELGIKDSEKLSKDDLIDIINQIQTKDTVNKILMNIEGLRPVAFSSLLVDFWFGAFMRNKWITSIVTIMFFIVLVLGITYLDYKEKSELEQLKAESLDLSKRVNELDEIKTNLNSLIQFIENQKELIIMTEQNLKELENKRNELEPIVNLQQETVEAILQQQEKRNYKNRWMERFIGFGLGIAASIIASIIYGLFKRMRAIN